MNAKQETHQRAMVAKLPREELEDQHLKMMDENRLLKTHGRKQEERIKKISTKFVKLANDRKKLLAQEGVHRSAREVDLEEKIENQQDTIRHLTKENENLKQKLRVVNQQMMTQGKRQTPYSRVQSRIDSGVARKMESPEKARSVGRSERMSTRTGSPQPPRYGHSLLEEARNENHRLHEQILVLHEQVARMEEERMNGEEDRRRMVANHDVEVLRLREQFNLTQKSTLGDNVEMIKLQRMMKERSNDVTSMESRYRELQDNYQRVRTNYDGVLHEMERLKSKLVEEESKNLALQNTLKHGSTHQRVISQLQEQIRELESEVKILKDANDRLTDSAFDQEKEKQWRNLERNLRLQIAQLETAIQADMSHKDDILNKISNERGYSSRLHSQSRRAHEELDRIKHENRELKERLRLYTASDDSVDVDELREALSVIRQRKHAAAQKQRPDFLEDLNDSAKDLEAEFTELQTQHAETIQELDKTREMLLMQHKINKDYQIEVESVSNQMEEMKREYEAKLERFARLLDARAARIKKLETQLHDVAYGTKQFKFQPDKDEMEVDESLDETIQLERGENLFEINVTKVTLTNNAMATVDDRDPTLFVTYAFYDYELVSTPLLRSSSPLFDFTAQYTVKVDDLFLHHLQKEGTVFELHQAMGIDHRTIASCKIRFNQLLDKPQGKLHGSATLTGINGGNFGTLDFWVRLRVPMDQAIRLYRERTKALGYLSANTATTQKTLEAADSNMDTTVDNTNQLLLQITSCNHVHGRREGIQPNIYCVYKFYDFADHDTVIIPSTNNPHFDDRQTYPVQMTFDLDAYLKSEKLIIYVFDDTDPDMTSYLGKASIDLLPLAHNKVIKAPFQLMRSDNTENGTIEISVRWQLTYRSPEGVMKGERSIEDEEELREAQKLMMKPPATPKKRQSVATKLSKPSMSSTPKPAKHDDIKPVKHKVSEPIMLDEPEPLMHEEEPATREEESAMHDEPISEIVEAEKPTKVLPPPILVKENKPTPVKRERTLKHDESRDQTRPMKLDDLQDSIETVAKQPAKKVSIVEPTHDKPVPLARSTQAAKMEEEEDFDEESDDVLEELEPDAEEEDETSPKPIQVKATEDGASPEQIPSPPPETETLDQEAQEKSPPASEHYVEGSDAASLDSHTAVPMATTEVDVDKVDDQEEQADGKEDDNKDEESEIEEDLDIEEIPDDTVAPQEESGKEEEEKESTNENEDSDTIRISINHLTLDPGTSVWGDASVEKMFIEYDFLGDVVETPDAVAKPTGKEKMSFKFNNEIKVDALHHSEQRNLLSNMLTSGHTLFKMTLVSEPNIDEEEEDCEEIGTASVDLAAILKNGRDIIADDITVEDLRNPEEVVGKLNVTVEAIAVLREIRRELDARLRESES